MTWLSDDAVARLRSIVTEPDFTGTRYELIREIARGGMGAVYEALDRELSRHVAIKVLLPEHDIAGGAARLHAEASLIAGLEHPGIVSVHDRGTLADGSEYYVMKLVRGATLSSMKPGSVNELLRLFVRICEPVAFAHARGVVHCDLKPANIMVGEFGEVLVMDWGVANGRGGTRGYMAPEQDAGSISPATDVFALGTMLRQMLAGNSVPRRLKAIVAKASADAPDARYGSARELADDILRFIDDQPVTAYREGILERAGRWAIRNRTLLAVVGAYLLMRAIVLIAVGR